MKIICISGKAQMGKDYTARVLKEQLEEKGNRVLIAHNADLLKYICKTFFNWNGKKDEVGRAMLQVIGTDTIRNKDSDYWVRFIRDILNFFPNEWDYVLIPDTRFENEITILSEVFDVITVRIERPDYTNSLTNEQQNHISETALDNYAFDYRLFNSGDKNYCENVYEFVTWLLER